jgi:hypothetical protein
MVLHKDLRILYIAIFLKTTVLFVHFLTDYLQAAMGNIPQPKVQKKSTLIEYNHRFANERRCKKSEMVKN